MEKPHQVFHLPLPLAIHPALLGAPRLSEDDPQMLAWLEGFKRSQRMPPIYVDSENRIVDGRHRYWCARNLQWENVPCVRVADDEIATVILETLNNRRHYSKGARAYLSFPYFKPAFEEAKARRIENLRKSQTFAETNSVRFELKSPAQFAEKMALSVRLLEQAHEIHDIFERDGKAYPWNEIPEEVATLYPGRDKLTFKEYFEPQILREDSPMGLGSVLKGVGYKKTNTQPDDTTKPQIKSGQLELFHESVATLFQRVCKLPDFAEATPAIREIIAGIHSDAELTMLELMAQEMEKQIAARKKALTRKA